MVDYTKSTSIYTQMMTLHNTSPVYLIVLINSGDEVFVIVTLIIASKKYTIFYKYL